MAKISISVVFFLVTLTLVSSGHSHNRVLRMLDKRTKSITSLSETIISLLEDLTVRSDTCNDGLDDVENSLDVMTDKLDNCNLGNVDFLTTIVAGNDSSIYVKVSNELKWCMTYYAIDQSNNEGKAYCLRYALWNYRPDQESIQSDRRKRDAADSVKNKNAGQMVDKVLRKKRNAHNFNIKDYAGGINGTPPSGFRTRKEYHTLSQQERERFNNATKTLYENGIIKCFAELHFAARKGAHRGPAFLPWHRAFIAYFEEALRTVDSSVSLPYWDSTIENNLVTSGVSGIASIIWDEDHLGNPDGPVNTGPFADWMARGNPLSRNVATKGKTISQAKIDTIMSKLPCTYDKFRRRWENQHNGVHAWVGGTMRKNYSPYDPIFYMHHAFIDYQWQKFRDRQKTNICGGIDPTTDYPEKESIAEPKHWPSSPMDGMPFLRNIDGMSDWWTEATWYKYEDTPRCPSCGSTSDVFCDTINQRCMPMSRFALSDTLEEMRAVVETANMQHMDTSEIAGAMVRGEIPLPKYSAAIQEQLDKERDWSLKYPPDNDLPFFQADPEDGNDCKNAETLVFDILTAEERGVMIIPPRKHATTTEVYEYETPFHGHA